MDVLGDSSNCCDMRKECGSGDEDALKQNQVSGSIFQAPDFAFSKPGAMFFNESILQSTTDMKL